MAHKSFPSQFQPVKNPIFDNQALPKQEAPVPSTFGSTIIQPQLQQDMTRYRGTLKFFNEANEYGFIVNDLDGKDIFFHFADVRQEHMLTKQFLRYGKDSYHIRFEFNIFRYFGGKGPSSKAVEISLIECTPLSSLP